MRYDSQSAGRVTTHTKSELLKYDQLSLKEKLGFLKKSFSLRNVTDIHATYRDVYLRKLEIASMAKWLKNKSKIVDFGCGNGYSLIEFAKKIKNAQITGVDFSEDLIAGGHFLLKKHKKNLKSKINFVCDDVLKHLDTMKDRHYDAITTERFLQNLPTSRLQKVVLTKAIQKLKKGGRLLLCEASQEYFDALNDLRCNVGLKKIPNRHQQNPYIVRLKNKNLESFLAKKGMKRIAIQGYSFYFLISRVLHPLLVKPKNPKFESPINFFAHKIQNTSPFLPGLGTNTLWVFQKQ